MAQNTNRTANNNQSATAKNPMIVEPIQFKLPNGNRGAFGVDGKGLVKLAIWDGKKKIFDVSYRAY